MEFVGLHSASFTHYTVTIIQVQESVSDFKPESESHKNEDSASLFVTMHIHGARNYTIASELYGLQLLIASMSCSVGLK